MLFAPACTIRSPSLAPLAPYSIGLDDGQNASGAQRCMAMNGGGGMEYISYEIYRDDAMTERWSNTSGVDTIDETSSGTPIRPNVQGRIPGGQPLPTPGNYTDTGQITVTYSAALKRLSHTLSPAFQLGFFLRSAEEASPIKRANINGEN